MRPKEKKNKGKLTITKNKWTRFFVK
ncbi:hypothetical protein CGLO_14077 [Colletotrichum gloeosporioides Cg-14]|uniref:Uncharacterized protein n=1 Tax=Colletotrichum gloeosporioides (strain Cg-14) TaxID=1237896 RepID=T0K283_COLGC|nr:hypothetical protein CGLO_14077 [Colletotrichum gloeosporioides Cg-14]